MLPVEHFSKLMRTVADSAAHRLLGGSRLQPLARRVSFVLVLSGVTGCAGSVSGFTSPEPNLAQHMPFESRMLPGFSNLLANGLQLQVPGVSRVGTSLQPKGSKQAAEPAPPHLPVGKTVLHIGDSFAGALGRDLNRELATRQVKGVVKFETATYIPTWASDARVDAYLTTYKPDLVLITLGGNDLEVADPGSRARSIRRLVGRLRGVPCVWVGIPLWQKAPDALLRVISENAAPCLYLDSNLLVPGLQRAKDGIHPSQQGRRRWAQGVVGWLEERTDPRIDDHWAWLPDAGNAPAPHAESGESTVNSRALGTAR